MTLGSTTRKGDSKPASDTNATTDGAEAAAQYSPQLVRPLAPPAAAPYPIPNPSLYGLLPIPVYGAYPYASPAMSPYVGAPAPDLTTVPDPVEDEAEDPNDLWLKDPWGEAEAAKRKLESEKKLKAIGAGLQRKPKSGMFSKALLGEDPKTARAKKTKKTGKKVSTSIAAKACRVVSQSDVPVNAVKAKRKTTDSNPVKGDAKQVATASITDFPSPCKRAKVKTAEFPQQIVESQTTPQQPLPPNQLQLMQQYYLAQMAGYAVSCGYSARSQYSAYNNAHFMPPTTQPANHAGWGSSSFQGHPDKESILLQAARATTQ